MNKLDFKHFKKLHSNENTTTFKHKDGHEIKIAHSRLKKEFKQQLQDLPKFSNGGPILSNTKKIKNSIEETFGKGRGPASEEQPTPIGQSIQYSESDEEKRKRIRNQYQMTKEPVRGYADGGEIPDYLMPNSEQPQQDLSNISDINLPQASQDVSALTDLANQPSNISLGQQQSQQPAVLPPKEVTSPIKEASILQQSGISNEAKAMGAEGGQKAEEYRNFAGNITTIQQDYERTFANIQRERQSIRDDIAGSHIDPDRYLNKMSDSGRISTAIGLILGGLGGGLLHQENPALKFLNNQIERDVQAQIQDLGAKKNLLSAVHEQFGDLKDSTNMLRATYADLYSNKIAEIAAKSTDPIVKARAEQAIGKLQESVAPLLMQTAQRQAILQGLQEGKANREQGVNILVPEAQRNEAYKELKEHHTLQSTVTRVENAMRKVANLQTVENRALHPFNTKSAIDSANLSILSLAPELFGKTTEQEVEIIKKGALIKLTDTPEIVSEKIRDIQEALLKHEKYPVLEAFGLAPSKIQKTGNKKSRGGTAGY